MLEGGEEVRVDRCPVEAQGTWGPAGSHGSVLADLRHGSYRPDSTCPLKNPSCFLVAKSCPPLLRPHGLLPARLLCPWNSPGKNTFLLQGIFPTQGPNPCLLHWQVDSLSLSHQGIIPDWFLKAPNPSLVLPSS